MKNDKLTYQELERKVLELENFISDNKIVAVNQPALSQLKENGDNPYLVDGKYGISDLLDLDSLRYIFERFSESTGFTIGFLSHPEMDILVTAGWRDICTKFHRSCKISEDICIKSNSLLVNSLSYPKQIKIEACENGMIDCATPIIIKGKHIATLATGQLLLEAPDIEYFRQQARKYGYNEQAYLDALKEIPVCSEKSLAGTTLLLGEIASIISEMGYTNLVIKEKTKQLEMEIAERKLVEEKLLENEKKLSTFFESMTEMVCMYELVFNEQGEAVNFRMTDCNNSYTKISGIKKEDVIGKLATQVYPGKIPDLEECIRVAITGEPYEYTKFFVPYDKYLRVSIVSPKKNHFATITTDITAIQRTQEIISAKNKELENYLYVASHDLRSPLVNIQGFSQRLQKQTEMINDAIYNHAGENEVKNIIKKITEEEIPKTLDFIFTNVSKMDKLISGLLQISRTGRLKMAIKKVNMKHLIETVVQAYNFEIEKLSARIIIKDLTECYGDENHLNQLFSNIIANAIKYTDKNRKLIVTIDSKEQYNKVIYSIKDNGIGIASRHLERIWDVFFRVNSSSPEEGEGLGLSIVKRIVEKHKGKIWIESEEGKGTIFYIELNKNEFSE